jgi:hypothetical protein
MALTRTSTSAAITANQVTNLGITSTTNFPAVGALSSRQLVMIDSEYMMVDQVVASGTINVLQRGYNGTIAVAHDILAPVVTSATAADWAAVPWGGLDSRPPYNEEQATVGQNGAIPIPVKNTTYLLTKATALSSTTLAAPAKDQDGLRVTFTSATAAAHVLTATSLFADAVSGSPHSTATFAAYIGASLSVEAANGVWNIVNSTGITVT